MFKFLKDKLKGVVDSIKDKVEEVVTTEEVEVKKDVKKLKKEVKKKETKKKVKKPEVKKKEKVKEKKPKKVKKEKKTEKEKKEKKFKEKPEKEIKEEEKESFFKKIFKKQPGSKIPEPKDTSILKKEKEKVEEVIEEEPEEVIEEEKGFFKKITEKVTKFNLSEEKFEELFWQLEVILLENNVAVEVIDKIKDDLKEELTTGKISRKGVEEVIKNTLRKSIEEVLDVESVDLLKQVKKKKPYIIAFIGVNGSGKTTSMAKVAKLLMNNNLSVVFAAADTFRAAAIQQLEVHANKLGVKMIKHDYNADPSAVAFDAIEHAKSKGIDVVMIDTAGRLHSNTNLMEELKKLVRVNNPDMKIFVGESITGNDCVEQARVYDEEVGINAIILSKADVDEKGGAAISVSYITKKPILYLGTGQTYDDLTKFDKKLVLDSLEL